MEMKQNQTFFYGTYSNLTPYLSLSKIIKIFQELSKMKSLSFMTKETQIIEMKQNQRHFSMGRIQIILKYFNDFHNWNFSISLKM